MCCSNAYAYQIKIHSFSDVISLLRAINHAHLWQTNQVWGTMSATDIMPEIEEINTVALQKKRREKKQQCTRGWFAQIQCDMSVPIEHFRDCHTCLFQEHFITHKYKNSLLLCRELSIKLSIQYLKSDRSWIYGLQCHSFRIFKTNAWHGFTELFYNIRGYEKSTIQ